WWPVEEGGGPRRGRGCPGGKDEQPPRQGARADPADGGARRRRGPLVLRRLWLTLVHPADRVGRLGGDRPQGAADLLEHGLLPRPVRQRRGRAGYGVAPGHAGRCPPPGPPAP